MSVSRSAVISFIICLIVSLTPISAVETADFMNSSDIQSTEASIDDNVNDIDALTDELNGHTNVINNDLNYVKSNWWKFWRWSKVKSRISQIKDEANQLTPITDQIVLKSQEIKENTTKLNELNNDDGFIDIDGLVVQIEKRMNLPYDHIDVSKPENFKEGDIVQYKSQGKFNRYLEYVKTDNLTKYVILKNKDNRYIALSQEYFNNITTAKLSPKTPNSQILNTIYGIQTDYIQYKIDKSNHNKKDRLNYLSKTSDKLFWAGFGLLIGSASALFVTLFFGGYVGAAYALVILSASIACSTSSYVLADQWDDLKGSIDSNVALANEFSEDLNNYPNSFPMSGNMNLTTNVGVPVNGTLNATDFDGNKLTYKIVKEPEHGVLNISENGSFVYTPNGNYKGKDSFKYSANDGVVDSNIADVSITVSAINTHLNTGNLTGKVGQRVNLTAVLRDDNNMAMAGKNVIFKVNGTVVGNATTNENGTAVLRYYLLRNTGKFIINAVFNGDTMYNASNATAFLNILKLK